MEHLDAGKLINRNQAQPDLSEISLPEPMQKVDQVNLAKQIVLEPKHDLIVIREVREGLMLITQLGRALADGHVVGFRQVLRSNVEEIRLSQISRGGPADHRLTPRDVGAGNVSVPRGLGGRIAVMNVEHWGLCS